MKIRKAYQGTVPENKILDTYSTSQTDTYSCNYVNKANDYSTTETVIGKWVNSKPIYRKVFTGLTTPNTTNAWNTVATLSNVDDIIRLEGWFVSDDGRKQQTNFPQPSYEFAISFLNGNIQMRPCTDYWKNRSCFVIAEYTKSTD